VKHCGESGNKRREAARSTAHFVPVHNFLSGIRCDYAQTEWVSERHRERSGANCGRSALPPGGVPGVSAAQRCRPHEGHVATDRRALAPALSVAAPARLPRPVQRSVTQDIVARKREPASVSNQARARTSRAASFGRDSFSPVASSAACRRLPTVFR
jgi:hypothetical protein